MCIELGTISRPLDSRAFAACNDQRLSSSILMKVYQYIARQELNQNHETSKLKPLLSTAQHIPVSTDIRHNVFISMLHKQLQA